MASAFAAETVTRSKQSCQAEVPAKDLLQPSKITVRSSMSSAGLFAPTLHVEVESKTWNRSKQAKLRGRLAQGDAVRLLTVEDKPGEVYASS